jgi:transcriptional regulator with XRE-family HTH domain
MVTILTNTMQALFTDKGISEDDPYTAGMSGGRPTNRKAPPFGERLAALRTAQGLSQSDFAAKVGVTREMVNYYERRAKNPTADFVQKAAKVLGVGADELLGVKPLPPRKPGPASKLQQKIERLRDLPETKQKLVLDLLETVLQSEPARAR